MARGRPRKQRNRYITTGKLEPERALAPALIKRIVDKATKDANNPWLGSAIGQLRLAGIVTDNQLTAGTMFCELVSTHDRIKGIPSRHAKSPTYQMGIGASLTEPPSEQEIARVESRYQAARAALNGTYQLVNELTVYDRTPVGEREIYFTRLGLDRLCEHFRLTK